ncbi:MAG: hypothetical protein ACK6AD_08685 [Cyanobacteriota bacterium]|jgi:hypothetical protein
MEHHHQFAQPAQQRRANHLLMLCAVPAIASFEYVAMTANERKEAPGLDQGGFHQLRMALMKGKESSDQDGNMLCDHNLRIPEMNPVSMTSGLFLGNRTPAVSLKKLNASKS